MKVRLVNKAERRRRIRISVAAWAYENHRRPIMSDSAYDDLSNEIRPELPTGNPTLDAFFRDHFDYDTGLWIHKHPNPEGLEDIYARVWAPTLYPKKRRRKKRR